jgi:hypothetical protein
MGILLAFAPFFVFFVVERLIGVTAGLAAATVTSAGLLVREALWGAARFTSWYPERLRAKPDQQSPWDGVGASEIERPTRLSFFPTQSFREPTRGNPLSSGVIPARPGRDGSPCPEILPFQPPTRADP